MTQSAPHEAAAATEDWVAAAVRIAGHYRIGVSPEQIRVDASWASDEDRLRRIARNAGLGLAELAPSALSGARLPLVAQFKDGQLGVIETETADGFGIAFSNEQGMRTPVSKKDLLARITQLFALRPLSEKADRRVDEYISAYRPDWLRRIVLADLAPFRAIMVASLMTNILALAGIIFSMQVYDRVVPGQSYNTLYVLFGGVMLATLFGLLIKILRNRITDSVGKAADLRMSDRVFGHAIRVRNSARPRATGVFISQVRELESVRDMLTSTTVAAIADVPFFLLFSVLFYYIAGSLVWIPVIAAVLLIVPGLLAQKRLRRLAEANMRESTLRSAMLVETIQGLDDIKSLQAESRFQTHWGHYNEVTATSSMALRDLVGQLSAWAQTVQGGVFAVVVCVGAPLVMAGEMSTGVLVAASMLSSRMIAPLGSVTQILNRWQQARIGRRALDQLMALPVDSPETERRVHKPLITGNFSVKKAAFGHDGAAPVLAVADLEIAPGERIAILGRNGAGKSTLLSGLAGLLEPIAGDVRLDELTMSFIDPADLRRDVGLLGQSARLFHGTLRENLTLGRAQASDEQIFAVLEQLGSAEFVHKLEAGLDHVLQEGGLGLSGGQRQVLLLARLLLREPRVLLLDEPTASLDETAEARVIDTLSGMPDDVSIVVATHRPAMLRLVDRIIVVHNGTVALDGPKDDVLRRLKGGGDT